ncbi:hypothetical protein LTR94_030967, partial [Friedmanniomyces endolithicus]
MGLFLSEHGDPGQAAHMLSQALGQDLEGGLRLRVVQAMGRRLSGLNPSHWHPVLEADLVRLLSEPDLDPQILSRVVARTLLLKYPVLEPSAEALAAVGRDQLWLAFLSRCLNTDAAMEMRLNELRAALVQTPVDAGGQDQALVLSLARQASLAEYLDEKPR